MTDDGFVEFETRDGPKRFRVVRNPNPIIEISETALHERDGIKPGGDDVPATVQIVVDSRGRHRSIVPGGEESTYHLSDHEVVNVIDTPDGRGGRTRRYRVRRKDE